MFKSSIFRCIILLPEIYHIVMTCRYAPKTVLPFCTHRKDFSSYRHRNPQQLCLTFLYPDACPSFFFTFGSEPNSANRCGTCWKGNTATANEISKTMGVKCTSIQVLFVCINKSMKHRNVCGDISLKHSFHY